MSPIARFRLVVLIAICMRRLLIEIIRLSGEKTLRSATELQWMAVYAEQHDASLVFNKHLFSRERVMAHVPFWAQTILGTPPDKRTDGSCRKLHALLRGLRSFDKFTEEIQMALCRAFTMERVEEGRIVLKNGHVGLSFYFIYSGSVFVNQEDVTRQGRVFARTVATLSRGDSFGELALLQDIRRTATISVRERCELLVVDRDVFASVCPRIFDRELAEKHAFIKKLDLFSSSYWSPEAIHSLSLNSQIQEFKINKIIVGDSSLEDWIYICMVGKCQVIRCLSLDRAPADGEQARRESDIVLSEEILQLLTSGDGARHDTVLDRGDCKENMLSSLQLDYVQTSKKHYMGSGPDAERKRALLGIEDAMTLTSFMRRQSELGRKNLVYLNVGILESGDIFDLPSLLSTKPAEHAGGLSTLMLVSAGARIVRIKKAAFHDQASQQALDNTRTLASRLCTPPEQTILESYKTKVAWEDFKASLVRQVQEEKVTRAQPYTQLHRLTPSHKNGLGVTNAQARAGAASMRYKNSQIISALKARSDRENLGKGFFFATDASDEDDESDSEVDDIEGGGGECDNGRAHSNEKADQQRGKDRKKRTFQRRKWSLTLEDMQASGGARDKIIIRRQPSAVDQKRKIRMRSNEPALTPRTTHSSSTGTWLFPPALRMF